MGATSNWTAFDTDFPVNGSPRDKLVFAAKYATLSPAERLWQPWELKVSGHFAELFAREGSSVETLDPERRETMISCGTSLQYLKLALKHHGCLGRVEVFPDLDRPMLAARIHAGCSGERDPQEAQLFEAMKSQGVNSLTPKESPVPDAMLDVLSRAAAREHGWLEFARSENSQRRLTELASARDRVEIDELGFQNETVIRTTGGGWNPGDITSTRLRNRFFFWKKPALTVKVRVSSPTTHELHEQGKPVAKNGTYAVLKTKTDDRRGWLAAGQTMARLILHARALGLSCSFFTGVLGRPDLRAELRTSIGHKGFTQAILCFGAAHAQASLHSRPHHAVTTTASSA